MNYKEIIKSRNTRIAIIETLTKINRKFSILLQYKVFTGKRLNLKFPITFNEKVQWLKLYWEDPTARKCADKYEVREYVKTRGLEDTLNEVYGVFNSVEEININDLPDSFVLKATHGSGWNILCKNKKELDWEKSVHLMNSWLKTNYFWRNGEWVYQNLKPRLICEKYLSDEMGNPPKDYKIFCFDGEPKIIQVDFDRHTSHGRNFYDLDWNFRNVEIQYPNNPQVIIDKPDCLEELLEKSRLLSKGFPHVRVDFYILDNKIIFGELTFFHGSGFEKFKPYNFEVEMGNWITIPGE